MQQLAMRGRASNDESLESYDEIIGRRIRIDFNAGTRLARGQRTGKIQRHNKQGQHIVLVVVLRRGDDTRNRLHLNHQRATVVRRTCLATAWRWFVRWLTAFLRRRWTATVAAAVPSALCTARTSAARGARPLLSGTRMKSATDCSATRRIGLPIGAATSHGRPAIQNGQRHHSVENGSPHTNRDVVDE